MAKVMVSFSGGRTSAYMAWLVKREWGDEHELAFLFANTGQEHEATLEFVHRCDLEFGLGVVWLEAVVREGRQGCSWRQVTYETASRQGEPFEAVIQKYGIPNKGYPHCTRELKLNPMDFWMRDHGWGDAWKCIGIRADEMDRMQANAAEKRIRYPLVSPWPTSKAMVRSFWDQQTFDLQLEELHGNCVTCWKKSWRKLMTLALDEPERFEWNARMEQQYAKQRPERGQQHFFRDHTSTEDLIARAKSEPFSRWTPEQQQDLFGWMDPMDQPGGGCTESCEVEW